MNPDNREVPIELAIKSEVEISIEKDLRDFSNRQMVEKSRVAKVLIAAIPRVYDTQ